MFKTGILLDSFQVSFDEALKIAALSGADGVQFYAVPNEMASFELDFKKAGELRDKIGEYGLEIASICGDTGGHGFEREDENKSKIKKALEIIDFAAELGTDIITTHIGVVPEEDPAKRARMQEALHKVCSYAEKSGIYIAVETGPEPSAVLKKFIEETGEKALKVNFDPANLVMVQGEKPGESVQILKDFIVHTHAKDGRMIKKCNPEKIYNAFAEGNPEELDIDSFFVELPLGSGDVNFPVYLQELHGVGYSGYLTIEREAGNDRIKDIKNGISFLKGVAV